MIFGYSIIGAIIVGLILGVLAKLFLRGKQAVPLWLTILVGIVAAIIGNYVATLFGVADTFGFDWIRAWSWAIASSQRSRTIRSSVERSFGRASAPRLPNSFLIIARGRLPGIRQGP